MGLFNLGRVQPKHRGEYDAAASYEACDIVTHAGNAYWCVSETPVSGVAPTNTAYWELLVCGGGGEPIITLTAPLDADDILESGLYFIPYHTENAHLPFHATGGLMRVSATPSFTRQNMLLDTLAGVTCTCVREKYTEPADPATVYLPKTATSWSRWRPVGGAVLFDAPDLNGYIEPGAYMLSPNAIVDGNSDTIANYGDMVVYINGPEIDDEPILIADMKLVVDRTQYVIGYVEQYEGMVGGVHSYLERRVIIGNITQMLFDFESLKFIAARPGTIRVGCYGDPDAVDESIMWGQWRII